MLSKLLKYFKPCLLLYLLAFKGEIIAKSYKNKDDENSTCKNFKLIAGNLTTAKLVLKSIKSLDLYVKSLPASLATTNLFFYLQDFARKTFKTLQIPISRNLSCYLFLLI
jgi:hypothetical protein